MDVCKAAQNGPRNMGLCQFHINWLKKSENVWGQWHDQFKTFASMWHLQKYMLINIRFHWAIENMCSCFTNLIFDMRTRLESFKFCSDEQNRCGCLMILISNHSLVWQFTWYQYKRMMKINEVRISGDINIKSQMVRPLMVSTWYRYTVVSFLSRSNRNQWSKNDRN